MRKVLSAMSVGTFMALGATSPALAVDDNIGLVVEPQVAKAGGTVKLTANNCNTQTATVTFVPNSLEPIILDRSIGNNSVWNNLKIPTDLPAGVYTATAQCHGSEVRAVQTLYVYHQGPTPHKAPATGGMDLSGTSGMTLTAAGVGIAGLGTFLGVIAWRRQRASLVE